MKYNNIRKFIKNNLLDDHYDKHNYEKIIESVNDFAEDCRENNISIEEGIKFLEERQKDKIRKCGE